MSIPSRFSFTTSLRALTATLVISLAGCSGGGGGSTPPVYSPVGLFAGTAQGVNNTQGAMALRVYSDGSGEFGVQFPGYPQVDMNFDSVVGHVDGNNFTISHAIMYFPGYSGSCPFELSGHMVSENEMDGSYTSTCGNNGGTVPFRITRTELQSILKGTSAPKLIKAP